LLQECELDLKKRECRYLENEIRLNHFSELDIQARFDELKSKYEMELDHVKNELKEQKKENKRLNDSFKLLKQSNETMKNNVYFNCVLLLFVFETVLYV
jgi:hypothetical protein